jgi:aryl sulfotransferase
MNTPTRKYRSMVMDSDRWAGWRPRAGDVIVATYPKCGTTWTQQIVSLLINQSAAPRDIMGEAPWLDTTIFDPIEEMLSQLEAQDHRRSVKSHLPLDSFPVFDGTKVIHTVRDGRDACVSMHNHMLGTRVDRVASLLAQAPPEVLSRSPPRPPPEDPHDWYLQWMDTAERYQPGDPELPFCEFELTYWDRRREPWLLFVHYNDLKADLAGEMRRISEFLEIETTPGLLAELAEAATFESMKRHGDELLPRVGEHFDKGPERFLNKGTNGRWKDFLTEADLARYDALVARKLNPAPRAWIEHGRLIAGDPQVLPD